MEIPVYNQNAEKAGTIKVSDAVFALPMNRDLLHQVTVSQRSNQRTRVAHTKDRSEVRGGGKKPWRQKGTGRARHGSIRSPIWKGGGATFGPRKDKDYTKKINKKMSRKALAVALSSKVRDGQFIVVDALSIEEPKTKLAAKVMRTISGLFSPTEKESRMLLVIPTTKDNTLVRSVRNLPKVEVIEARNLNSFEVLAHPYMVVLKESVEAIEKGFNK